MKRLILVGVLALLFSSATTSSFAYYTNMAASVVVGQSDFVTATTGLSASKVDVMDAVSVEGNTMAIVDRNNNRVLIFNSIPGNNGASADVVLGQPDFGTNTTNFGGLSASSLSTPNSVLIKNGRLYVGDRGNNRVLIWNSIPRANDATADVVLLKTSFTDATNTTTQTTGSLGVGGSIASDGTRLIISSLTDNRVLIWNQIPTSNGAPADVVLGQQSFTINKANDSDGDNVTDSVAANTLNQPFGIYFNGNKLYVVDSTNNRVLIWNSLPSTSGKAADVVVGQQSMTVNAINDSNGDNTTDNITANDLGVPRGVYADNGRLFVTDDQNDRVLIWNQDPTSNGASANIVVGQSDMLSNNNPGSQSVSILGPRDLGGLKHIVISGGKMFVCQTIHGVATRSRLLIFNDDPDPPGLSVFNTPQYQKGGLYRMVGTVNVGSNYLVQNVEYSVNGGAFASAIPTDGGFNSANEDFYFDFNPSLNQPRDSLGRPIDGYTIKVRSLNNNVNLRDGLLYISTFDQKSPADHSFEDFPRPTFAFAVNKQETILSDNLAKYQIQVRHAGGDSIPWQTYIDGVPVDFRIAKGSVSNLQKEVFGHLNTANGVYESDKIIVTYADDSSTITVKSKDTALAGSYQWKVVAVDKSGHRQETTTRDMTVAFTAFATNELPLTLLNKIGLPWSLTPTFYGVAWGSSTVKLYLFTTGWAKTYTTAANASSRFGITIPKGDLLPGLTYTGILSTTFRTKYNEIPKFSFTIMPSTTTGFFSPLPTENIVPAVTTLPVDTPLPTPAPTPFPSSPPPPEPVTQKTCIWFICW
jgi:hypothetical protein